MKWTKILQNSNLYEHINGKLNSTLHNRVSTAKKWILNWIDHGYTGSTHKNNMTFHVVRLELESFLTKSYANKCLKKAAMSKGQFKLKQPRASRDPVYYPLCLFCGRWLNDRYWHYALSSNKIQAVHTFSISILSNKLYLTFAYSKCQVQMGTQPCVERSSVDAT